MAGEKYTPKVGDIVAIEVLRKPPVRGEVTRVMKHLAEVSTHPTCNERRFSLPSLREVGASGYRVAHITPWAEEHDREARLAKAIDAFHHLTGRLAGHFSDRLAALHVERIEEANAVLRMLVQDAKEVKS